MFSYWIGRLLRLDIRTIGDGNPGASNLWSAAGMKFGIIGIVLDFMKGYVPILVAMHFGVLSGYGTVPIALAPIVGHAFSPFLKFNGGKSLAVTFGVWSALTQFRGSVGFALILAGLYVITRVLKRGRTASSNEDALQVVVGFLLLSTYFLSSHYPAPLLWVWLGNLIILLWKSKSAILRLFSTKGQEGEKRFYV